MKKIMIASLATAAFLATSASAGEQGKAGALRDGSDRMTGKVVELRDQKNQIVLEIGEGSRNFEGLKKGDVVHVSKKGDWGAKGKERGEKMVDPKHDASHAVGSQTGSGTK